MFIFFSFSFFFRFLVLIPFVFKDPDAELDPEEVITIPQDKASTAAEESFRSILEHGSKIHLDHHLIYHTRSFFSLLIFLFIHPKKNNTTQIMNSDDSSLVKVTLTSPDRSLN